MSNNTGIKNIIFDYGNVIFMIDFKKTQTAFTDLGIKNVDRFFSHAGHHPLFDDFEKGNITSSDFRNGIREFTQSPHLTDTEIDQAWNSLLIGVPDGNHQILLKTKEKYRTFLLSNNNEIHYQWIMGYLKREFDISSNSIFFERDYYSQLLKMRKPNADIFEFILKENTLNPAETLFIDDSSQHLKTAADLGLQTHLLTPGETLAQYMTNSGLI
ncbi:MAG: HAD family phosphatase [Daejeonella sp.]